MSVTLKIVAAALVLSAFAPAAFAGPAGTKETSFRVAYSDLDMSEAKSGGKLLARIEKAARKACDAAVPNSPLFVREEINCRNQTVASTVEKLGFPVLTAAWSGKYETTQVAAR